MKQRLCAVGLFFCLFGLVVPGCDALNWYGNQWADAGAGPDPCCHDPAKPHTFACSIHLVPKGCINSTGGPCTGMVCTQRAPVGCQSNALTAWQYAMQYALYQHPKDEALNAAVGTPNMDQCVQTHCMKARRPPRPAGDAGPPEPDDLTCDAMDPPVCLQVDDPCMQDGDCCTNICSEGGNCELCRGDLEGCVSDNECCSHVCSLNGCGGYSPHHAPPGGA